jgi:hypothetical protein
VLGASLCVGYDGGVQLWRKFAVKFYFADRVLDSGFSRLNVDWDGRSATVHRHRPAFGRKHERYD